MQIGERIYKYLEEKGMSQAEFVSRTGDNRYKELLADKEGVSNMCDVAQRLEDRGIQIGIEKGRAEERAKCNQMIYSLVEDNSISMEKGAEKLGISVEKLKDDMVKAGYNV